MPSNFYVVSKSSRVYVIPFIGLKPGIHTFDFSITDTFFEEIDYSILHSGNVDVRLELEKKETMLIADFTIDGFVFTDCDRCTDPVEVKVNGEYHIIFKFGHETSDDENLIVLHPDEFELDIRNNIYELITVSMPSRCIHAQGDCNEEMLSTLEDYLVNPDDEDEDWEDEDFDDDEDDDEDDIDPRWKSLKDLN